MTNKDKESTGSSTGLPEGAKLIANLSADGRHQTPTWYSKAVGYGGFFTSIFASIFASGIAEEAWKEKSSSWRNFKTGSPLTDGLAEGFTRFFDIKHWRSNAVALGVATTGWIASDFARNAIERRTFQKRYGDHPAFKPDALATIPGFQKTSEKPKSEHQVSESEHRGKIASEKGIEKDPESLAI